MSNKLIKNKKNSPEEENAGVAVYNIIGGCFLVCGIVSLLLLGFVRLMPQDYEKYNVPLFFGVCFVISLIFLALGILPLLLGKYSARYRRWVEKDVMKWAKKEMQKEMQKEMKNKPEKP